MPLRMPCPTKRIGSSFLQFRRRVPADLIGRTKGVLLTIPLGSTTVSKRLSEGAEEVSFSLRTRDPSEAKWRQASALAYLESVWEALRRGDEPPPRQPTVVPLGTVSRPLSAKPSDTPEDPLRLTDLVNAWWREAKAGGRSPKTLQAYGGAVSNLVAFLGHEDASRVTIEDVIRFKDARLAAGISLKTIRDGDLASLRSIYRWAIDNKKVNANPAAAVRVPAERKPVLRSKGFTDAEALAVLRHSARCELVRQSKKTFAAKRWVPWLLAYTGARVGEIGQLRKDDVLTVNGHLIIRITPEAGTVKGKRAREVPLHPHLVELGFLPFVEGVNDRHLFIRPGNGGDVLGPLQGLKNRLTEFVRAVVPDPGVAPNHGWRHRFKTVGREVGIADTTLDAIVGHAAASIGAAYGDVSLKTKAAAVALLPRYDIGIAFPGVGER